jgi:RNA-directed DNA polymerase
MMHGRGKSDSATVAGKPTNKAGQAAAEPAERRAEAKGNAGQQSTRRAQDRESVSQALERIRQVARQRKKERFTSLFHHISVELLRVAFFALKRDAAPGVDGLTWQDYEADLDRRIEDLHARVQREAYRGLGRLGDNTYRRPMASSAGSRLPHWKIKSFRRRYAGC